MSGRTCERWEAPTVARYPVPKSVQFVSAEEFLRLALQSHLAAVRDSIPPVGERWQDAEVQLAWSSPQDFFDGLLHHLGERLRRRALARGDLVEVPYGDGADLLVGEAHGDASPALVASMQGQQSDRQGGNTSAAALPAEPLLLGLQGQKLPLQGMTDHTQTHEGQVSHG